MCQGIEEDLFHRRGEGGSACLTRGMGGIGYGWVALGPLGIAASCGEGWKCRVAVRPRERHECPAWVYKHVHTGGFICTCIAVYPHIRIVV